MSLPALADLERALAEMDAEELRLVTTDHDGQSTRREAQSLRDLVTFCEGLVQMTNDPAYNVVRDPCLRLAESRKP